MKDHTEVVCKMVKNDTNISLESFKTTVGQQYKIAYQDIFLQIKQSMLLATVA